MDNGPRVRFHHCVNKLGRPIRKGKKHRYYAKRKPKQYKKRQYAYKKKRYGQKKKKTYAYKKPGYGHKIINPTYSLMKDRSIQFGRY